MFGVLVTHFVARVRIIRACACRLHGAGDAIALAQSEFVE
ncbi:hypothetical protein BRCON_0001 [Candidatus Sumerlaea chitinivorans]|uniref:Uncharacterized protein n=1 Tax=Sumerlaea chitinivorans TaxID=2250252 RepID=A0A2Z4Y1N2_SUMC1|nr:hypothetical protein BRCON_0001 [Candidatus Sumerlaea chitinivorans]